MDNNKRTKNPKRMPPGVKPKIENQGKILRRLMGYILKNYKLHCFAVGLLIILSSVANVIGTLFLKKLIDEYILPFVNETNPDFSKLFGALMYMALIYLVGVASTYLFNIWVGRIAAIAADCKSAGFKSTLVRVQPCPLMFACASSLWWCFFLI